MKHKLTIVAFCLFSGSLVAPAIADDDKTNSDIKSLCVTMAEEEGVLNEKTEGACVCLAAAADKDETIADELSAASELAPGDEREGSYSDVVLETFEACGPWE